MEIQTLYQKAIKFAASKHLGHTLPGTDLPYLVHVCNVAMEVMLASLKTENFNLSFAVPVALLHDTIEDSDTSFEELVEIFGVEVAKGVMALTKNDEIPKAERMIDSLSRIKMQPKEVWAVKLADRITNLQAPPSHWDAKKRLKYQAQSQVILNEMKDGNVYLAERLEAKIAEYRQYL